MTEFRKKPVVINAVQLNWQNWNEVCELVGAVINPDSPGFYIKKEEVSDTCGEPGPEYIAIKVTTTHGEEAIVRHGDWIILDSKPGTFYPCKPDVFAKTYDAVEGVEEGFESRGIDFGHALAAVKEGKLIAREGWHGKGMFVFQRPADSLSVEFIRDKVKSLPQALKDYYGGNYSDPRNNDAPVPASEVLVNFSAYLCLKTPGHDIANGWVPSTGDLMATDWLVLE